MSPTTLYREGTDLDDLLAELDSSYPGQVRVVEVTRPREGGVLGFFAKQRVGVHYRLVGSAETPFATAGVEGSRVPGNDAAVGARAAEPAGYDAASVAGSAAPTRSGLFQDGFGPDPAAIRAALARRAPASPEARPVRAEAIARDDVTADAAAPVAEVAEAATAPGMAFARILADLALKKASLPGSVADVAAMPRGAVAAGAATPAAARAAVPTAAAPRAGAPAGHAGPAASPTLGPSATASGSAVPAAADVSAAARTFAAMDFAALTPLDLNAAVSRTAAAAAPAAAAATHAMVGAASPADESAPVAVPAPAITLRRHSPRAVPRFQTQPPAETAPAVEAAPAPEPTRAAAPAPAVTLAFTDLPRVDASGAVAGPTRPVDATIGTAAPAPAAPRPGALSWPLATPVRSAATATAVLERAAGPDGEMPPDAGASMRGASYGLDESAAARTSTPLTLRRKLLEVGVPVDRVPSDSVHAYAAIEELVSDLGPAPELPSAPGQVLVVAGPARDAVTAADSVIAGNPGVFDKTWTYGCPAALSTRRVSTTANTIASVQQAGEVAEAARASSEGPILVVVSTDTAGKAASEVLDALGADVVWAAVDATRKPSDTRRALQALPQPDAIVVANTERSVSPATVWDLELPIALVDGRPSTGPAWAVLLLGKLAELEESACSAAPC